ncbi:hypothetical protein PR002_g30133 [Phytophthora rubi]|nr:hypothetical protein PR002_g30133 [Phytophthora rubi]
MRDGKQRLLIPARPVRRSAWTRSGARTSPGRPPGGSTLSDTRAVAWSSSTCCSPVPVWCHFGYRRNCTVLQVEECQVTQVKMADCHGFNALQLGVGLRKAKNVTKPVLGHRAKRQLAGQFVAVGGTSKGKKGFQCVMTMAAPRARRRTWPRPTPSRTRTRAASSPTTSARTAVYAQLSDSTSTQVDIKGISWKGMEDSKELTPSWCLS